MASPIEDMIEDIEEYIESCKPVAFSSSKISVNRDEIQNLLEELRSKTPEEIRRYQKIISNEKAIIADAQRKANNILAEAQIKTDELVSEHQIMQQAYAQAQEVVNMATQQARELMDRATNDANNFRARAIEYTDSLLKEVQEVLLRSRDTTQMMADNYIKEIQTQLDRVVANRMELSPTPEEVIVNEPQPKITVPTRPTPAPSAAKSATQDASQAAAQPAAAKANAAQTSGKPEGGADDKGAAAKGTGSKMGILNLSEKHFNKE
ncbi:MAG: ATPase [Lachnospiraceae bacterium]|nr:ATPase [Lachnospiraceae bacterium]